MLSFIGGVLGFLSAAFKLLFGWAIYHAGENAQAKSDEDSTIATIEREDQARSDASSSREDVIKRLEDGSA